jgi:hypothetical protein
MSTRGYPLAEAGIPDRRHSVDTPSMATVLVDAENVRRSLWPNMSGDELSGRSAAWADANGHDVIVVWEGRESADDRIVREVRELDPPVWVVTSDHELRERVRPFVEQIVGGGSFARELRDQRE